MNTIKLKIKGLSPLLMHSDRYANPIDPDNIEHKKITSKKKKTEEDHHAIMRSEWKGGLYIDPKGPYLPAQNFKSCLIGGAKLNRLGAAFGRSVVNIDDRLYLEYDGPKQEEDLWNDGSYLDVRSVVVGAARLMRARPIFEQWGFEVTLAYHSSIVDDHQIITAAENAGNFIGLGDYRPDKKGNFGRFSVERIK